MKKFNGKAIYCPSGKAGEYAEYACNFYNGCSNNCDYCYCKRGVLAHSLGGDTPTLKKCFRDEEHALEVFEKELLANLPELQRHGLFFSFTTDPMLPETGAMTLAAVSLCGKNNVPVKILTKRTTHIEQFLCNIIDLDWSKIAWGFTLTGHDELEPGASTNAERIEAMKKLHAAGFKTFASIEPIVDFESSARMIGASMDFCDLYKIGLMSGRKYGGFEARLFIERVIKWCIKDRPQVRFYFKDSLLTLAEMERMGLPHNCVGRDFNLFKP